MEWLDNLLSPLILQGQTPNMILKNHPESHCSVKTLYNYIESGALSERNIDLPRKVKYKLFDNIETAIGAYFFNQTFTLVITDRGGEFQNPDALECGKDNVVRTSIYYCDPMCSWQKPHGEKNHEYIRKICPKGTTFDNYTQRDINLMMSHINSSARQSLGGAIPMTLAKLMLPKELLDYFGLMDISFTNHGLPVSWTIGTSPDAELVNTMLDKAISILGCNKHPIVHSDRGCHFQWPGWIERMENISFDQCQKRAVHRTTRHVRGSLAA